MHNYRKKIMNYKPRILIAEDEKIIAIDIKMTLTRFGYEVIAIVKNALEAIQKAEECKPDLILMDIMLGGYLDGIEAAKIISFRHNIPIIYLTALTDENTLLRANVKEPYQFLTKPFKEDELNHAIEKTLSRIKAEKDQS